MTAPASPTFPVDEVTLNLLEHSLQGAYSIDAAGEFRWSGSEFSFSQLLDFASGYDPRLSVPDADDPRIHHYTGHLFSERDVLLALLNEVRELRRKVAAS